jgi:uncharacterized protein (DUF302 family)
MPASPATLPEADIVSKITSGTVADAVTSLTELITDRELTVFAVIDHSGEARRHGTALRDTKVVFFGSPAAGTPVMQAAPLAALDLPLKVLLWDDGGQTTISYLDPPALATRHHLDQDLASRLAGIGPLTDALVAMGDRHGGTPG